MGSTTSRYALPYPAESDSADPPHDFSQLANTADGIITGYIAQGSGTAPSSPQGTIWLQTDSGYVMYKTTSGWTNISSSVIQASSAPTAYSTYTTGRLWLNTSTNALSVYTGSGWQIVSNFPATMGSAGTVLTSNGSTTAWSSLPSATYNTPVAHAYCSQSSTMYLNNTMSTLGFDASNASDGGITITWSLTQNSGGSNFTALSSSNSVTGIKVATAGWYQITGTIGYQIPVGGSSAGLVGVSIATGTTSTSATGAVVRLYNGETVGGDVLSVQTSELLNLSSNTVVSLAGFAEQFYKILSGSSYLTLQLVSTTS